ncbi:MAG: hypothetical protein UZ16_OP3001002040 [Candidatus Hinthialibacteria bacterium OLB16]|nr:MAG: hypothetical protein UZ16_OP3001002040 [Candidatus Hinthialibacteria bacterium OLB16]
MLPVKNMVDFRARPLFLWVLPLIASVWIFSGVCPSSSAEVAVSGSSEMKPLVTPPGSRGPVLQAPLDDLSYAISFHQVYTLIEPPFTAQNYPAVSRFLGSTLTTSINQMKANQYYPFNFSPWMEAFNLMYLHTHDLIYVNENIRLIRSILAYRDDVRGVPLFDGTIRPVWGETGYSSFGREYFAVDDGAVLYPMLQFLEITQEHPEAMERLLPGEFESMLSMINQTLTFHAAQFREGPAPGEGRFIFLRTDLAYFVNKPQPPNWMSSIGRAYWLSWKLTGNTQFKEIALAMAQYAKNRISLATDGACYWGYWFPLNPVSPDPVPRDTIRGLPGYDWIEDVSHAGLTVSFWILMASEGQVFTHADMLRLGKTVSLGFARLNNGVIFPDLVGNPITSLISRIPGMAPFLHLARFDPEVYSRIGDFYFHYWPSPGPLEGALLVTQDPSLPQNNSSVESWTLY